MRETIKKGMIECAWFSTWCSHAEEYGFKEHGGFGGCAIEQIAPTPDFAQMSDVADRVLARLEAEVDVNYEDESLYCDDCEAKIESAYGASDESEES